MPNLFLRLFAEADASEAFVLADRLRKTIEAVVSRASVRTVRPYWKIPEYQEICLEVSALVDPGQALTALTSQLGSGWTLLNAREAIWNQSDQSSFAEPLVRWAHVEVQE